MYFDSIIGADLARAGDLPVTVLAGRLPDAASTDEVAVTLGYLRRLGLTKSGADEVLDTEVTLGAPRAFSELDRRRVRGPVDAHEDRRCRCAGGSPG